jgi:hypothetical protein
MSQTYPDLTFTNFPEQIDTINNFVDITLSSLPLAKEYYEKYNAGDITGANQIIENNPQLKYAQINASTLNPIVDSIKALQRFYMSDVQNYLMEIVKSKGAWSPIVKYAKYDVVTYVNNSAFESFMCTSKNTPISTVPTDTSYWIPLTLRGEKGEAGIGLTNYGDWNEVTNYPIDALVAHNNALWGAKVSNNAITPSINAISTWYKVIDFSSDFANYKDLVTQKEFKFTINNSKLYMENRNDVSDKILIVTQQDIPSSLPANGGTADTISQTLPISKGGTGATTASSALTNLGLTATATQLNYTNGVTSNIQTQLNTKASKSTKADATLLASSWSGSSSPYTYTLAVAGVTATNVIELIPQNTITTDQLKAMVNAIIASGTQTSNSITLLAFGDKPTIDLPITTIIRGDI